MANAEAFRYFTGQGAGCKTPCNSVVKNKK